MVVREPVTAQAPPTGHRESAGLPLTATGLRRAVQDRLLGPFDVEVDAGELVALAGPNGSGKTTCIRLVLGLDRAAAGRSLIHGREVSPMRPPRRVGYVPDRAVFWDWRSGYDNVRAFAAADHEVAGLLGQVGLADAAKVTVRRYSRGMRQRLAIARALAAQPRLLVLDEPTIALDAAGADMLVGVLSHRRAVGLATLVATHDADFVGRLDARRVRIEEGHTVP